MRAISEALPRPTFVRRLLGAALLDARTYEDVEADRGATLQAAAVVVLSSLAAGVGARGFGPHGLAAIAAFAGIALVAWAAWSLVTFEIGVRLMPDVDTRADIGELLRTIGFATAPGVVRVLGVVPGLAWPVFILTAVWMLAAMVVAVRQALDYRTTRRAIAVCLVGWLFAIGFVVLLGLGLGSVVS